MVAIMARKAIARRPRLWPASVFVMMSLTQVPFPLPLRVTTWASPCLATSGTASHTYRPSALRDDSQHLVSGSPSQISTKKLRPTVAATRTPAAAANAVAGNGRTAAERLLAAANQIANVAGRKIRVTGDTSTEKLAANESRPKTARNAPRDPGLLTCDAIKTSTYGAAHVRLKTKLPASCSLTLGSSRGKNVKAPRIMAGTRPMTAATTAAPEPRPSTASE